MPLNVYSCELHTANDNLTLSIHTLTNNSRQTDRQTDNNNNNNYKRVGLQTDV